MSVFHFKRRADTGCWEWWGGRDAHGYGKSSDPDTGEYIAHRMVWVELMGPIPDGLVLDHLCHNKCCVNPSHLEPVTAAENVRRAAKWKAGGGETCKKGLHPMSPENTTTDGRCRCCHRDYHREYARKFTSKRARMSA